MEEQEIFLYIDTNFIKINHSDRKLDKFEINKNLEYILKTQWTKKFHIVIPTVVIEELSYQMQRKYNKVLETLNKKFTEEFLHEKLEKSEEYLSRIRNEAIECFKQKNITILESVETLETQKLLYKALNYELPFGGKNPANPTDAGFKDAVIIETILDFSKQHNDKKHIFISNDKDMQSNEIEIFSVTNTNELEQELKQYNIYNFTEISDYILEMLASEKEFDKSKTTIKLINDFGNEKTVHVIFEDNEIYEVEIYIGDEIENMEYKILSEEGQNE